jgi:hypothetical protein
MAILCWAAKNSLRGTVTASHPLKGPKIPVITVYCYVCVSGLKMENVGYLKLGMHQGVRV